MIARWTYRLVVGGTIGVLGMPGSAVRREQVCFVDDGLKDQSLVTFRNKVLVAARQKSLIQLRPLVAFDVYVTKESSGWQKLVTLYRLDDRQSEYWSIFADSLVGGKFVSSNRFCAPFYSCPFPPPWAADQIVILGRDVPAFERPARDSSVLQRLSCDVLKSASAPDEPAAPLGWTAIRLESGGWAYVEAKFAVDPNGYRVEAQKRAGRWRLVTVAGRED